MGGRQPGRAQFRSGSFTGLARGAVDQSRSVAGALLDQADEARQALAVCVHALGDEVQVGAVEAAYEYGRARHAQGRAELLAQFRRGGGRKGRQKGRARCRQEGWDLHVGRPEVVAPAHDAVGLVDGHEGHADPAQQLQEAGRRQTLRRDIQELQLSAGEGLLGRPAFVIGLVAVQAGGGNSQAFQCPHLVAHERDER